MNVPKELKQHSLGKHMGIFKKPVFILLLFLLDVWKITYKRQKLKPINSWQMEKQMNWWSVSHRLLAVLIPC